MELTKHTKLNPSEVMTEAAMFAAVSTLDDNEGKVFDFYCKNHDRIARDKQTLRFIVERDLMYERLAKDKEIADKKVDEEFAVMQKNAAENALKAEAEAAKEAKKIEDDDKDDWGKNTTKTPTPTKK